MAGQKCIKLCQMRLPVIAGRFWKCDSHSSPDILWACMSALITTNNQVWKSTQFSIYSCKTTTSSPLERNYNQMKVTLVSNHIKLQSLVHKRTTQRYFYEAYTEFALCKETHYLMIHYCVWLNWHGYAWQGCKENLCCHAKCLSTCVCLFSGLIRLSMVLILLIQRFHSCTVHAGFRKVAFDAEKAQFCPSPRLDQASLMFCLCTCDLYFPGCISPSV